jgi:hypothetical protein
MFQIKPGHGNCILSSVPSREQKVGPISGHELAWVVDLFRSFTLQVPTFHISDMQIDHTETHTRVLCSDTFYDNIKSIPLSKTIGTGMSSEFQPE